MSSEQPKKRGFSETLTTLFISLFAFIYIIYLYIVCAFHTWRFSYNSTKIHQLILFINCWRYKIWNRKMRNQRQRNICKTFHWNCIVENCSLTFGCFFSFCIFLLLLVALNATLTIFIRCKWKIVEQKRQNRVQIVSW